LLYYFQDVQILIHQKLMKPVSLFFI
jgi:hypothetical protein